MLTIDGSYGEGGGQVVRSAVTLAAILGRPVQIINIRAGRKVPGLAAQHLTAVGAAAMICDADLRGAEAGSTHVTFVPQANPVAGDYEFDVAAAREGGSAGAATLVLQTILLPLALVKGPSTATVRGGTHVAWSPTFHYFRDVYLTALAKLGILASGELLNWGWFPAGEGAISLSLPGNAGPTYPVDWSVRGELEQVFGVAVASGLPSHIAQRICNRAKNLLTQVGLSGTVQPVRTKSVSPGAGIFLTAQYQRINAGFGALGKKGKPSDQVAQEAVDAFLAFHHSPAVIDSHLADQLVLPLALHGQPAVLTVEAITEHTRTNVWVAEQFLGTVARVNDRERQLIFGQ
jgi:RNA 3'-terminal phosphate cyclase (ATP)